jgi:hypothetical protein
VNRRVWVRGHYTYGRSGGGRKIAFTIWSWFCPCCTAMNGFQHSSWRQAYDEALAHARRHKGGADG